MEIKTFGVFVGILLVGFMMLGLVEGAGYSVTVPAAVVVDTGGSGGGSSGGGSSTGFTYSVTAEQLAVGYSKEISSNDRFKISVDNESHYVKLVGVTATTVTINVSSETQQATLTVGDVRKFEVSGDNNYDLSIKLNSINITSSKADLTIMSISEEVTEETIEEELEKEDAADEPANIAIGIKGKLWIWSGIALIVVIGIVVVYLKRKKK